MIKKDTPLKEVLRLAAPCRCDECRTGCRFGSGILADGDLENISRFLKISQEELKQAFLEEIEQFNKKMLRPKLIRNKSLPHGKCTFYDEKKGCTIHDVKPLQCKTSISCRDYGEELAAWFLVNKIIDASDAESVRQYAQYLRSGGMKIEGAALEEIILDKSRLRKILSYEILK